MPVDYDILEKFGSTERALRLIFTIPDAGSELPRDHEDYLKEYLKRLDDDGIEYSYTKEKKRFEAKLRNARTKWEKRIESRIMEGRLWNFQNYRWHYAADLAWDGPVFADQIPLTLFAQGRIDVKDCAKKLEDTLGKDKAKEYIEYDRNKGVTPVGINATRLGDKVINMVRPYITRRKAALSNKFNDLYPWLNFEPRSRTMAGKIRAEVTTQRIEQVVDARGMRHDFTQWIHKMLLHSGQWVFVNDPWRVEKAYRKNDAGNPESYVVSEGPILDHPHPTRVFYDRAHGPSRINYDKGISYCGYWDMVRYRDVKDNPAYFNATNIRFSTDHEEEFRSYRDFFKAYFSDENRIKFVPDRADPLNPMRNDRQSKTGLYADHDGDCSVFFTHYYERVVPKDAGFGTYPYPVWVKLTVINDKTVVRARVLPSRPAAFFGHNQDDTRDQNVAMAHEILPFQDQAQDLVSQLYYLLRMEQLLLLAIDTDLIPDKEIRGKIREYLEGKRSRPEALYVEWSGMKIREVQKSDAKQSPFQFIHSTVQPQIQAVLEGIGTTLDLLEKVLMMSPQELGQFVTKETNATEVTSVNKTTNALQSFVSEGPDEGRAALKVILYESLMASGEDEVPTPVVAQFPQSAIKDAGFEILEGEDDTDPESFIVSGIKKQMAHNFVHNSRDGSERTVSVEASKTLYQFVNQILANESLLRMFGWKQVSEMISEVFRLSGSPFVIKLPPNLPEGGPGAATPEQQQLQERFDQLLEQMRSMEETDSNAQERISEIETSVQTLLDELSEEAESAAEEETETANTQ